MGEGVGPGKGRKELGVLVGTDLNRSHHQS